MAVFILIFTYKGNTCCTAQKYLIAITSERNSFAEISLFSLGKKKYRAIRLCEWGGSRGYRMRIEVLFTCIKLKCFESARAFPPWKMLWPLILSPVIESHCWRFVNGFQNVLVAPPIVSCLHFFITTCILLVNRCKINSLSQMFLFSLTAQQ